MSAPSRRPKSSQSSRLETILDDRESLRERDPQASLQQFLARECGSVDNSLARLVQQRMAALQAMDQLLAGPGPADDATRNVSNQDADNPLVENSLPMFCGGEPIAGYRLQIRIAAGGFGEVWRAIGPGNFPVAMKFVPLGRKSRAEAKALQIARQARHPHVIATFGAWQRSGYLVIAMELAEHSLQDRLEAAKAAGLPGIPRDELLGNLRDVASGLDFLNQSTTARDAVQHRDIKPQNLLVVGGRVKIADLGIARVVQGAATGHTGQLSLPRLYRIRHSSERTPAGVNTRAGVNKPLPPAASGEVHGWPLAWFRGCCWSVCCCYCSGLIVHRDRSRSKRRQRHRSWPGNKHRPCSSSPEHSRRMIAAKMPVRAFLSPVASRSASRPDAVRFPEVHISGPVQNRKPELR